MSYHLVAAAQSLIRTRNPRYFAEAIERNQVVPIISLRDISIGYSFDQHKDRLVVACHEQPATMLEASEYNPKWDISSDDGLIDQFEGNTVAEREHTCLAELLLREKTRRDAFRYQVLRLRSIHSHPGNVSQGEALLSDIPMSGTDLLEYASWEGLAKSVYEYHEILTNVVPAAKADKEALTMHIELLAEERAARSAEATLRRDQGLELERLRNVATTAQARELRLESLLEELREEMKLRATEEVEARETFKSDLMRAQAREAALAHQLGALQARYEALQADLAARPGSTPLEVGRGLPGFTPSSVGGMSYQTPYTDQPTLHTSALLNSGESNVVNPGSAESEGTMVQFLQNQQDLTFLGKESKLDDSSSAGLRAPHPRTNKGDPSSQTSGSVGSMGPPASRMQGGTDQSSSHSASGVSTLVHTSMSHYGPAGGGVTKVDPTVPASPGGGTVSDRLDVAKLVPESMKKKTLKSLEVEPLTAFREVFRYHLKAGDPCTDWHLWVPDELHAAIRRRLQSLLDPSTHEPKYTTALAENWPTMNVVDCLDDLINAKSIPNVVGLPMETALGSMRFQNKLLDPSYYETVESMLTVLYKKYGGNYNQQRNDISVPLTKALDRSFKATTSGSTVAKLIRSEDPSKKGYVPDTVAGYVDAAARHAVNKHKLDQSKRLYEQTTWEGSDKKDSSSDKPLCPGCGSRGHPFANCSFKKSEWFNPDEDVAFADSKMGKAYIAAKGKAWIQSKDNKKGQKRTQRDYESSDQRRDASRRRVSSRSRERDADENDHAWDRRRPRDRRLDSRDSDSERFRRGGRGVSFDRDRSRSPSQTRQPSGDSGRHRESSAESVRRSESNDRHDSATKDKDKGGSTRSKPQEASKESRGSSSRDGRARSSSPHSSKDKKSRSCECTDTADEYVQVCEYLSTVAVKSDVLREEDQLLAASLPHPSNPSDPRLPRLFVDVLPDTGAWSANYINEATAEWLRSVGIKREECRTSVCSGIGTSQQFCVPCGGTYTFLITIYNDLLEGDETLSITANEIPSMYAVLLGRKTIKQHNISLKCFRFFSNLETGESLRGFVSYNLYATVHKPQLCSSSMAATAAAKPQATIVVQGGVATKYAGTRPKSDFLSPEPDDDFIDPGDDYRMPWENDPDEGADNRDLNESANKDTDSFAASIGLEVFGSVRFIDMVDALLEEYADVFSTELGIEPADLPPLDVEIDVKKWHCPKNQGRARNQSVEGQQEIRRHIEKLLDCGAISPVLHAPAYSQVLLVKKPDTDEKRLVLDYRALNECVGHMNWPLPNINHMIERLGARRPKKFAKFDMTKGYWQLGLASAVRLATAFITWMGIFVWNRVPMGLQPAASYFQYCMLMIVLAGLAYDICEGYIDDIIVHGQSEEDLLENLRKVFERCRRYRIAFNPKKSKIGLDRIEWVGHQLDAEGLHFTAEQLSEVAQFPTPLGAKGLRSFLGLANYFRDHVRYYASMEAPLRAVLTHADRTKKFIWTTAAETAFLDMQDAIRKCAKLYFLVDEDETSLIVLRTDASDYGYGAYLCQIIDKQEYPVLFLSRSFKKSELNWKTQDKECFAIYKALEKFQYLLYNRTFVLETDSKNLTFLNNAPLSRVYRWKLAIQRYDFRLKHIPGEQNVVADAFSRCVFDEHSTEAFPVQAVAAMHELILTPEQHEQCGRCHNSTVGHHGVERTVKKMKAAGYVWPHLREHVRNFIRNCPCCQKMSYLRVPIVARRFTTTAPGPMEVLNIDYMGPLPEDEYGNMYVLTIIDTFSRGIGLYAVPSLEAKHTARMVIRHVGLFGCPSQIVSDRGTHFTADVIKEIMILMGTDHVLTLAASKQENAAVENANKRAQEFLRTMLFDHRIISRWSDVLPLVQRIMMAEPNEVIGVSPAQLLFGNAIQLDRGIFLPQLPVSGVETEVALSDWADRMLSAQRVLLDTAQRLQRQRDLMHMEQFNGVPTRFEIGSYVLVSYNPQKMNGRPPTKFHPRLKGPYLVANILGDKYTLQNLVNDELEDFHVTRLREFRYDDRFVDPRDVALRDVEEYYVERILAHTGNPTKLKTLQFHVKWRGFDESYNTWEPWKNLRETERLHLYLISKGLQKLIPAKFRDKYPECSDRRRLRRRLDPGVDARQDLETVVNAIGPLSILVPQYQDSAITTAVNAMGPMRTLIPQSSEATVNAMGLVSTLTSQKHKKLTATGPLSTLNPQDSEAPVTAMGLESTLTVQKHKKLTATGPMSTLIPQDNEASATAMGLASTLMVRKHKTVNAMVPSSTLILQDRSALVNTIVPPSILIPRNKTSFGTSAVGDKTSKTLKFASVTSTYWTEG